MLLYPRDAQESYLKGDRDCFEGIALKTPPCFSSLGLPFLCKKHECLLLAVEHFKVFGIETSSVT